MRVKGRGAGAGGGRREGNRHRKIDPKGGGDAVELGRQELGRHKRRRGKKNGKVAWYINLILPPLQESTIIKNSTLPTYLPTYTTYLPTTHHAQHTNTPCIPFSRCFRGCSLAPHIQHTWQIFFFGRCFVPPATSPRTKQHNNTYLHSVFIFVFFKVVASSHTYTQSI